jgi:hypothetical protein
MADLRFKQLEDQLKRIGCNFQFWGRAELKELANVLLPGEIVEHVVNGSYEGGFALLAATNQRVLLIDKKPMYLTLEDVRFDMIAEVDYNHRLMNANIFICTPNKSLRFTGYNHARLRKMFHFIQTRVMDIRQHYAHPTQPQEMQVQQSISPYQYEAIPANVATTLPPYQLQSAPQPQQPQATPLTSGQFMTTAQQLQVSPHAYHRVPPIISAYTRLPIMSRQRRFLGSRAMNTPLPSIYK